MKFELEFPDEDIPKTVEPAATRLISDTLRNWTAQSNVVNESRLACNESISKKITEQFANSAMLDSMIDDAIRKAIYQKVTVQVRKMELTPEMIELALKRGVE